MDIINILTNEIPKLVKTNQIFQGAAGAAIAGGVLYQAKSFIRSGWQLALRWFSVSLKVTNENLDNYVSFLEWLEKSELSRPSRNLELIHTPDQSDQPVISLHSEESTISGFVNTDDYYYCFLNGLPVKVSFSSESLNASKELRRIVNVVFYLRGSKFLKKIQEQISNFQKSKTIKQRTITVTKFTCCGNLLDWDREKAPMTTLDTIFAPNGEIERIKAKIANFKTSQPLYAKMGKTYKQNFIIAGPPGTGKSSVARAVAGEYNGILSILMTNSTDNHFLDSSNKSHAGVKLIEDIDCAKISINRTDESKSDSISLSSLLNVLDGPFTKEECITIITTNSPEELDPAITRPGRADEVITLRYLTAEEVVDCIKFFENMLDMKLPFTVDDFEVKTYKEFTGYRPCDISAKVFEYAQSIS